jgi:GntR family transcriptional regulator, trigonelline degradation regulator
MRIDRSWPRLRDRVIEVLRKAIQDGHFAPGERITERKLGELVGVSRTVIREALRQLEADGLIENRPYRGPAVALYSRDQIVEIYDVRKALESHAAQLFAERAAQAEVRALEAVLAKLAKLRARDGAAPYLALIERFYDVLFTGSRNALLRELHRSVRERAKLMRSGSVRHTLHLDATVAEKRAIVAAIAARDSARAIAASVDHIDAALKRALATLPPATETAAGK